MWRNLRSRLAISHLLPLLVIVPLLSLLLYYLLEARYVLEEATAQLAGQGELISRLYQAELSALEDEEQARSLFARLQVQVPVLFHVVDEEGNIVVRPGIATASTKVPLRPPDPELLRKALAGEIARQVRQGSASVAVPLHNEDREVVGAVHLSMQLTQVSNRLAILRWTVWGTVGAGLLVAVLLSFALSRSLNQPLERLTRASRAVNFDAAPNPVKEEGPTEVRTLARTFNEMSERLYELEQGRRRLLSAVVHELGRPLGAIKAAAAGDEPARHGVGDGRGTLFRYRRSGRSAAHVCSTIWPCWPAMIRAIWRSTSSPPTWARSSAKSAAVMTRASWKRRSRWSRTSLPMQSSRRQTRCGWARS